MAENRNNNKNKTRASSNSSRQSGRNVIHIDDVRYSRSGASQRTGTGSRTSQRSNAASSRKTAAKNTTAKKKPGKRKNTVEHRNVSGFGYEGAAKVFMVAFLILAVLYIGGNVIRYAMKSVVGYDVVQIGSIDTPKTAEGLIIRKETAYKAGMDGELTFFVADGERVKAGETVCAIREAETVDPAENTVNNINEEIIDTQANRQEIDGSNEDAKKFNLELKALADEAAMDFVVQDTAALKVFANNAIVKTEMRNQAILSTANTSKDGERKKAENVIAANSAAIAALEAGVVCLETDGRESELTPDTMYELSEDDITKNAEDSHVASGSASKDENVFKILTSNMWYIAAYVQSEYVYDWKEGERHTIYLTDAMGKSRDMDVIVDKIDAGAKETFLILKVSKYVADYMDIRNISFEIDKVKTGYKISNTSIVENTLIKIPEKYVTDSGAVYKLDSSGNTTEISVGDVSSRYAYFPTGYDTLKLNDVVVNPDDREDTYLLGDVVTRQGVYVMNTGMAEFCAIDTTNSSSNSTHTILDPDLNPNLNVYDRVIIEPKNIEANDMLYR